MIVNVARIWSVHSWYVVGKVVVNIVGMCAFCCFLQKRELSCLLKVACDQCIYFLNSHHFEILFSVCRLQVKFLP